MARNRTPAAPFAETMERVIAAADAMAAAVRAFDNADTTPDRGFLGKRSARDEAYGPMRDALGTYNLLRGTRGVSCGDLVTFAGVSGEWEVMGTDSDGEILATRVDDSDGHYAQRRRDEEFDIADVVSVITEEELHAHDGEDWLAAHDPRM